MPARLRLAFMFIPLHDLMPLIRLEYMMGFWPAVTLVIAIADFGAILPESASGRRQPNDARTGVQFFHEIRASTPVRAARACP
jgi:UPF0716 family protein affecting phage T7 exclusion